MFFITAQIVGFVALLFNILTFQAKRHRTMMSIQIVAATVYAVHFFMLGALVGAVLNMASALRAVIFRKYGQAGSGKRSLWPLLIIQIVGLVATIIIWQDWRSLLAAIGWQLSTLAFWQRREQRVRQLSLAGSPPWFAYDVLYGSIAGVATEILVSSSAIVGLWRFRKKVR
ncbi:YgjV family protein [Candidatus Saccharibacteria bacterium]|nr:YgjV family protein [Candidatus Saccharibacteria bacterium]